MRALFVATPLIGHLFQMMPLALRLRDTGHDVLVATGAGAARAIAADARAVEVAPAGGYLRNAARGLAAHPVLAVRATRGMADARGGARVFAAVNRSIRGRLHAVVADFAPDVVVYEPFAAAAAAVAARAGIPAVLHNIAFDNGMQIRSELLRLLRHNDCAPPAATFSIAPPSVVDVPGTPLQYTPYTTPGTETAAFLRRPPERPRILVTRSTMLGDGPDPMLRSVLRAAPHVDAEIVIVRPNRAVERADSLPANVRTVGWTALHEALPHCTAVVNHGGAGSVYAALHAGVPQLATPAPGDRRWNAELVQQRGAGLAARAGRITAEQLTALVTDAALADAARAVSAEIAAMPTVAAAADRTLALACASAPPNPRSTGTIP